MTIPVKNNNNNNKEKETKPKKTKSIYKKKNLRHLRNICVFFFVMEPRTSRLRHDVVDRMCHTNTTAIASSEQFQFIYDDNFL